VLEGYTCSIRRKKGELVREVRRVSSFLFKTQASSRQMDVASASGRRGREREGERDKKVDRSEGEN
jgi:hypothetical protein